MTTIEPTKLPLTLTGGCLCGEIRYAINFPEDADWPPKFNSTCQCTQCRKFTGGLWGHGLTLPTTYYLPPLSSNPTYKAYQVTPKSHRSFCSECGSPLAFHAGKIGDKNEWTEIYVGTLDEAMFMGKHGKVLAKPMYHGWLENAVEGVTDQFEETMYVTERAGGNGKTIEKK